MESKIFLALALVLALALATALGKKKARLGLARLGLLRLRLIRPLPSLAVICKSNVVRTRLLPTDFLGWIARLNTEKPTLGLRPILKRGRGNSHSSFTTGLPESRSHQIAREEPME